MSYTSLSQKSVGTALTVLLIYYCIYDLTSRQSVFPQVLTNSIVLIALGLVFVYMFLTGNKLFSKSSAAWYPFIGVLCVNLLSYNIPKSYVLLYALLAVLIANPYLHISSVDKVLKWLKIMGLIAAGGVLLQLFVPAIHNIIINLFFSQEGVAYIQQYAGRGYYSGVFHQVGDAAFYVSGAIIAYLFAGTEGKSNKYIIGFLFIILFLLGKRSLLLFLVAALLVTYIVMSESGSKKFIRIVGTALFAIVFLEVLKYLSVVYSDIKIFEKLAYTFSFLSEGNTDGLLEESGRLVLYGYALELFHQNYWTGIGWAQFSDKITDVLPSGSSLSVHNVYLQLLCETGVIGFAAFLLGAISSIIALVKTKRLLKYYKGYDKAEYEKLYAISLTGQILFLMFCFVENPIYNENDLIFYFLMILLNNILLQSIQNNSTLRIG